MEVDCGNLLVSSSKAIDTSIFKYTCCSEVTLPRQDPAKFLLEASRNCLQHLLNSIWEVIGSATASLMKQLPVMRDEEGVFAKVSVNVISSK
jgi:hypothetical protein